MDFYHVEAVLLCCWLLSAILNFIHALPEFLSTDCISAVISLINVYAETLLHSRDLYLRDMNEKKKM
jgi:hypothetical protein